MSQIVVEQCKPLTDCVDDIVISLTEAGCPTSVRATSSEGSNPNLAKCIADAIANERWACDGVPTVKAAYA